MVSISTPMAFIGAPVSLPSLRRFLPLPRPWGCRGRGGRVFCCLQPQIFQMRRCCPLLEGETRNKKSDSSDWKAVPDIWKTSAEKYGDRIALVDSYHSPPSVLTYKQLEQEILYFSEGLRVVGVNPDEKLALFADNSCRWLVADQGIMATGAINVVRGTRSSVEELLYIYNHSDSKALVMENPNFFSRLADTFISSSNIKFIILLWGDNSTINMKVMPDTPIFSYDEIIDMGKESRSSVLTSYKKEHNMYEEIGPNDVGTIIYTSGTTGSPKGVMLTHGNLLHQVRNMWEAVPVKPGDRFLSVLPPWHVYERACEYFTLSYGSEQVYTTVKNLKEDLRRYQPHYLISVPLIYETLYSAIQKQISSSSGIRKFLALNLIKISLLYMKMKRIYEGKVLLKRKRHNFFIIDSLEWFWGRIMAVILWPLHFLAGILVYKKIHSAIGISKAGISGGGSLPEHIDKFFEAIGIVVQNGYGLTETSPVVSVRRPSCNVLGTIGPPVQHTEIKIVDSETGQSLPDGSRGIIKVRGPQVMKGYYKNPSATYEVLDEEGWFNTGDIGWIAPKHATGRSRLCGGMIVIDGRAKDTIVLSTGENVEPLELEEAALCSSLIQQIVVVGQDQRRLGALIVPDKDELVLAARKLSTVSGDSTELATDMVMKLLRDELTHWTSGCTFQIGPFLVLEEPFTIDNGLMTPTMKVRRDKITAFYSKQIAELFM